MIESLGWLSAVLGGATLGLFYYAGLWFTLRNLPQQTHPALWVFGSFILRLAISVAGFYFILGPDRNRLRLGVALLAFIVARVVLTRRLQPVPSPEPRSNPDR